MKTKSIPATVMLVAGAVACIMNIINHSTLEDALKILLFVLILFYLIGSVIKVILDKNIKMMTEDPKEEEISQSEETVENLNEQVQDQENVQRNQENQENQENKKE